MRTPAEVRLRSFVTLAKGKPPAAQPYYGPDADRYLTPEYLRTGGECALVKAARRSARVEDGDTILLWDGSNAGEVLCGRAGILASTMSRASHAGRFDDAYFFYALKHWEPYLKAQTSGSGIPHIDKEICGNLAITEFDLREQAKIAEVLSTVDRAIEQTEALIAKQQRIKTGLTQDLLTRGIDEHGNIRSEKTHKFKDSPLGRIPVEWESRKLCQVLVQRPRNGLYKTASLIGRGTLLVGQTSFTQDRRLDFSLCRRAVVSPSEIETFGLVFGDILVTRVFATVDGIGQPVLVDSPPEPAVYESNMLLLRPSASMIDSLLLFTWLRSAATRRRVLCSVNASNQVSVNQTVLNSLPVPVPSISEQKRISQALGQIDAAVRCTDVSLQKLRLLKTGLMQDLLTGERRVTALLGSPKELVDA